MPESWLLEESAEDEESREREGTLSTLQFWGIEMRRMVEDVVVFEKYNYSSLSMLRLFGP